MWLFGFLLLPMVFASSVEVRTMYYSFEIQDHILTRINQINTTSEALDMSGLGLIGIEKNALSSVLHVKTVDLSNNSLSTVPVFPDYRRLEHLSLADNSIESLPVGAFSRLTLLKSLNISNNRIRYLGSGELFGLGKSTNVFTNGNPIRYVSTRVFEDPILPDKLGESLMKEEAERTTEYYEEDATPRTSVKIRVLDKNFRAKVCIREGTVEKLEVLVKPDELESHCKEVMIAHVDRAVFLNRLGITKFSDCWYRLSDYPIDILDLGDNNIVDVTAELLNKLPEGLQSINLANNKITRLVKGQISNNHLRGVGFVNNSISEIEDGAFENTNIRVLSLSGNRLTTTSFAASLPSTLTALGIDKNRIDELTPRSFSELNNLMYLNGESNNITELKSDIFRGLTALEMLSLSANKLKKIEPGAFRDLKSLKRLHLDDNCLTSLDKGTFRGLETIEVIYLYKNKLTKITGDSLDALPMTLNELNLDRNEIDSLQAGTFVNVPKVDLSLTDNKISKIEGGTFNLPTLKRLQLSNNSLSKPDGQSFAGLGKLRYLDLTRNNISKLEKATTKHLGGLFQLNISFNPVKELRNGALFGIPKSLGTSVAFYDTSIALIQGGVFDDM